MKIFTRLDDDTTKQTTQLFLNEIRSDKRRAVAFTILIPLSQTLRYVFMPLVMSLVIQSLITRPHDIQTPLLLIGSMGIAWAVSIISNHEGFIRLFNHEENANTRLTKTAMNKLLSHSYEFFASQKVGALGGDVMGFAKSYQATLDAIYLQASPVVVNYTASLIVIAVLSPLLLAPLLLLTGGIVALSVRSLKQRAPYRNKRKRLISQLSGQVADIFGNQILTKVFAREQSEVRTIIQERDVIEKIAHQEIIIIERESIFRQLLLFTFQIICLLGGIWLYTNNAVSIAALVFAVTYLGRVTDSMYSITTIIRTVEQALLDAMPITKIINQEIDVVDQDSAKELTVTSGDIDFRNVCFNYADSQGDVVFSGLNVNIPAGQRVGLAGYSGGGKTTLTKLLLRFADVSAGTITVDNQDISQVTQTSLRDKVAYVPQEPFLFHRTLRDNIAYGKPDASDKEIIAAAEKAHAMEFIDKLPAGLDTVVGERGVKLSGGQRQRVAIARAILKDAPILILDEATSALDSESERLIQASIAELMKNKTAIVIAHRLSTIAKLDRIIVIDKGEISEDGTHDELLAKNGIYAKLWKHQSGGFIESQ